MTRAYKKSLQKEDAPPPDKPPTAEPLALARPLALGLAAVVTAAAGLAWGQSGTLAALCGSALSLINVSVLERLAVRAARQVAVTGARGGRLRAAGGAGRQDRRVC